MVEKDVITELNDYLKGEYMEIHEYEHYIQHEQDEKIKNKLQQFQQEHKQHAAKIAERIQNLGGKAINDNGLKLSLQEFMMDMKGYPNQTNDILEEVIRGQEMGIEAAEELVHGNLDEESFRLVKDNLNEDRKQLETLKQLKNEG